MKSYLLDTSPIKAQYKSLKCKGLALIECDEYEQISKVWNEREIQSLYIDWESARIFRNGNGELAIEI